MSDIAAPRLPPAPSRPAARLPDILDYAERPEVEETGFDVLGQRALGVVVAWGGGLRARRLRAIVPATAAKASHFAALDDTGLRAEAARLRVALRRAASEPSRLPVAVTGEAFALVREAAARTLGLRPYDVQIMGAWAMLRGMIAEMRTGEGKTLSASLAAATAGLFGAPVHVITANDYLAERDAEELGPLYRFLGLSQGLVLPGQDAAARRAAYAADVVYGSNKEMAFDYLRDRMALRKRPGNLMRKLDRLTGGATGEPARMRGLHFAIVDEADSVLIDEARTPLIISGEEERQAGQDPALFQAALDAARLLTQGTDFRLQPDDHRVELTETGRDRLEDMAEDGGETGGAFRVAAIREHMVTQALTGLHLFHLDDDYIIRDGKVQIVDEFTGRVMADRSWSDGLQQLIELKEGLEITLPRRTMARISYQRYFRRYRHLCGMTGTARDASAELWAVYRLSVARIPTHRPEARVFARDRLFAREESKWQAIGRRVAELQAQGVPVLLGTRSVAASEKGSAALSLLAIPHEVLSARQDAEEAAIVARAGQRGAVTVATNMAGRGTDIKLGEGVAALGGLHVILAERHDSRRIDRQLEGRCGRQGDPGRVEAFLSLEDDLMRGSSAALGRRLARVALALSPRAAAGLIRLRQRRIERSHARARRDLLKADRSLGEMLAFSGQLE
ncbi:translocase [Halovulum dunhuangense]|uniref:Protein translocase subunit SecA n=1 Tax=Halovulum dunhuangense TaxID=1505036 RepID=A0A849L2B8_9RHOB|nr:translocase [Halovulum dunhuangense]NNU80367.1 translocase [Halovulum dunhuangense]